MSRPLPRFQCIQFEARVNAFHGQQQSLQQVIDEQRDRYATLKEAEAPLKKRLDSLKSQRDAAKKANDTLRAIEFIDSVIEAQRQYDVVHEQLLEAFDDGMQAVIRLRILTTQYEEAISALGVYEGMTA